MVCYTNKQNSNKLVTLEIINLSKRFHKRPDDEQKKVESKQTGPFCNLIASKWYWIHQVSSENEKYGLLISRLQGLWDKVFAVIWTLGSLFSSINGCFGIGSSTSFPTLPELSVERTTGHGPCCRKIHRICTVSRWMVMSTLQSMKQFETNTLDN